MMNSPGIEFWGQSFVCDPQGMIIAQASVDKEEILIAEIDLRELNTSDITGHSFEIEELILIRILQNDF